MKKLIIISIASILILGGCVRTSEMRKTVIGWSESNLKNVETLREVSRNLLKAWPFNSNLIKGHMGDKVKSLPVEVIEAMTQLDTLAMDVDALEDPGLGYSLGVMVRVKVSLIKEALKEMPDLLSLLKL